MEKIYTEQQMIGALLEYAQFVIKAMEGKVESMPAGVWASKHIKSSPKLPPTDEGVEEIISILDKELPLGADVGRQMKKRIAQAIATLFQTLLHQQAQERYEKAIATLYYECDYTVKAQIAKICDEIIDPSGALLGRVRNIAAFGDKTKER